MTEPIQFEEAPPERTCATCVSLVGRRTMEETVANWRCAKKENVHSITRDVVLGKSVYHYIHKDCYACRADERACGQEGKWWEEYKHTGYTQTEYPPRKSAAPRVNAEALLADLDRRLE